MKTLMHLANVIWMILFRKWPPGGNPCEVLFNVSEVKCTWRPPTHEAQVNDSCAVPHMSSIGYHNKMHFSRLYSR